jgi:hypothetical protein
VLRGAPVCRESIEPTHACKPILGGGTMRLDRERRTTTISTPVDLSPDVVVHPMLSFTAVVAAHWAGTQSYHAGAFVVAGAAWGVIGPKGAGKSTLLAALHRIGCGVVADDVVIVSDGRCLIGPRAVDLRPEAASQFPGARFAGHVNGRERWRLSLGRLEPQLPVAGWIVLEWGETAELEPVAPIARLKALDDARAVLLPPADPSGMLDMASLPMFTFRRPPAFGSLDVDARALVAGLAAHAAAR